MSRRAFTSPARGKTRTVSIGVFVALAVVLTALLCNPLRTLTSLRQADEHPLYVMHHYGPYSSELLLRSGLEEAIYERVRKMALEPVRASCVLWILPPRVAATAVSVVHAV